MAAFMRRKRLSANAEKITNAALRRESTIPGKQQIGISLQSKRILNYGCLFFCIAAQ